MAAVEQEVRELVAESNTVALLNKSEIDMQIATARKFPRSIKHFLEEARTMVSLTESVAESCIYALPRDGKTIEGPSARFAEVVASAWGNCRAGARVVNDQGDFITAQGVFHDLERNVATTFEVRRRIVDKRGNRFSADMIGVTGNAAASIALRNAVLKGVPRAFWDEVYNTARKTAIGDMQTLSNRRASAIKAFVARGITEQQILDTLDVAGIADIGIEHLAILTGIKTAIKEGDTTLEQAFKPKQADAKVLKPYPAETFETELKKWRAAIKEGKNTADRIIAMVSSSYALTEDQKAAIRADVNTGEIAQ